MEQLGNYLKIQRELRDISLDEVSRLTKISPMWLTAIEENNFEALPGRTYARGYVKAFARAIGLNEEEIMGRFDEAKIEIKEEEKVYKRIDLHPKPVFWFFALSVLIVILIILIISVV